MVRVVEAICQQWHERLRWWWWRWSCFQCENVLKGNSSYVRNKSSKITPTILKVQTYSLVSRMKHHSPDFTQLPSGHRTCSFIRHLNSPGSIQPGSHFRRTELLKDTSLHSPTRYPLTPGSRESTCEQSALPRSTTSEQIQSSRGSNPRSLACTSRTLPLSHDAPPIIYRSASICRCGVYLPL